MIPGSANSRERFGVQRHRLAGAPQGTVTMLFTDIEGSTRLLAELGDERYGVVLAEHHRLLRDAFDRHGGYEVQTEGDAFFVTFASATAAVAAAVMGQRSLAAHAFAHGGMVRVRMGVHTGEARVGVDSYVGLEVHRAARIGAAGHGGQIVLSEQTRSLVGAQGLPAGVTVRDLGIHRLKDIAEPQHLYDLAVDGLPSRFPPLRTLEPGPVELPAVADALIGRERELQRLATIVTEEGARLVTLTGAGGSGKTRLAVEAAARLADRFPDGIFFCDLAPLAEHGLVIPTIAAVLGLRDEGPRPVAERVAEYLHARRALLVLDNFEHVLDAASGIAQLLAATGQLRMVATSRLPLRIAAEREFPVAPLEPVDAAALFRERAATAAPTVALDEIEEAAVRQLCERVDRLPLAIELAAARLRTLTLEQLLARLDRRLSLLTSGRRDAPDRQQTLRATIDWSYQLLAPTAQQLLERLSVFAGGCTLDAAENVCDAQLDDLDALVDASLLRFDGHRFTQLETIREYASDRLLASGSHHAVAGRHCVYFVTVVEGVEDDLRGRDHARARDLLTADLDNLRAAMSHGFDSGAPELGARLASSLLYFWEGQSVPEGRHWLDRALEYEGQLPADVRARALAALPLYLGWSGNDSEIESRLAPVLPFLATTDRRAHARTLAWVASTREDAAAARHGYSEALALAREFGEPVDVADVLLMGWKPALVFEDPQGARRASEEALTLYRQVGDRVREGIALVNLGAVALEVGDWAEAAALTEQALGSDMPGGSVYSLCGALGNLAIARLMLGHHPETAEPLLEQAFHLNRTHGLGDCNECEFLAAQGCIAAQTDPALAVQLAACAQGVLERCDLSGAQPTVVDAMIDRYIRPLRSKIGETAFEAAWSTGYRTPPQQAWPTSAPSKVP